MASLIGIILAVAIGAFARWLGLDRDRAFYPTVMMVIALYYVLFAVAGGSAATVLGEAAVCLGFIIVAGIGFKKSPWLVVAALIAHGLFDWGHPHILENRGMPAWWPEFCSAYDVTAGAFLSLLLKRTPRDCA